MTDSNQIRRHCLYHPTGNDTIFGWLHLSSQQSSRIAAVICNPLGVEYMSGHRSIRHLADELAMGGIDSFRFDYVHTGDSSGGSFESASVSGILRDIVAATALVRDRGDDPIIVLIGIGLGATFAALAAKDAGVDHLVLWNPTINGRRFVREQKLLSEVLSEDSAQTNQTIDVAGILLTGSLQDEFRGIDLRTIEYSGVTSALVINRSDRKIDRKFETALAKSGVSVESVSMGGYKEMMDQPTETIVPTKVFRRITDWTAQRAAVDDTMQSRRLPSTPTYENHLRLAAGDHSTQSLVEVAELFGENRKLFGIATFRQDVSEAGPHRKAFVFLNCGSEHHAGPHRLYTILARNCASFGALSFRFDIEGIGDSITSGNNDDNNSYSPVALQDIEQALAFLKLKYGCDEFILSGICAGAYHSFKALAALQQFDIPEANLINPLVFEWNYDDPDDHLKFETHTYRTSVRKADNWRRLLSGDIDYVRLVRSFAVLTFEYLRRTAATARRLLFGTAAIGLPADMQNILANGKRIALVLSEGDPGLDIMKLQAGRETRLAMQKGLLTTHSLSNANHGLSKKTMQDQLVAYFIAKYGP